jgi:hypothetical protein
MCFFNSPEEAIEARGAVIHLENYDLREYSFHKLTQYSLGNNVLDAPASDRHGSPLKGTCVSTM